jgi:N6-adenosine-specific RNA methylase IME4
VGNGKYDVIYADPPWKGTTGNSAIADKSRVVDTGSFHYPAMETAAICALPVGLVVEEDALLFLWVRSPMLEDGLAVGSAWSFKFITIGFVWYKQRANPGSYTLSECEVCLLFKRGRIPSPRGSRNVRQFLSELRANHSKKPDTIRDRICDMFPAQKKLELFARGQVSGWDAMGYDIDGKDIRVALAEKLAEFEE